MALTPSFSDILKILDKIPLWGALKAIPERMEAAEKRIADLEGQVAALTGRAPGEVCKACGARAMRRTGTQTAYGHHPQSGVQLETWICAECGDSDRRLSGR